MSLPERWTQALDELRTQGRYRSFALPQGIDFTSNDYLGYASGRAPIGFTSTLPFTGAASRLLRGHHAIWEAVESDLRAWHGAEAVLMMTSGYAANEGLLSTVLEPGDWVATDELNHACIIDGLRLARPRKFVFRHNDLNHLEEGLKAEAEKSGDERARFIITEALFSMDGDLAPLPEIVTLAERYGAQVIVDEAHSTGCYGESGNGRVDALGLRSRVLATMHTGGKALACPGAYLCVTALLKEYLINRCRHLIFTTALPPAAGEWWQTMLPRIQADHTGRASLHANTARFRTLLTQAGAPVHGSEYVVPVVLGDDVKAVAIAKQVQSAGYDIRAIRPPSVPLGTSRLRISIHANHTPETVDALAALIPAG